MCVCVCVRCVLGRAIVNNIIPSVYIIAEKGRKKMNSTVLRVLKFDNNFDSLHVSTYLISEYQVALQFFLDQMEQKQLTLNRFPLQHSSIRYGLSIRHILDALIVYRVFKN